jgi:SPP1 gp7 family putative phage head morphogenesis protein
VYKFYNELFFNEIIENTGIKTAFKSLADTSIYERYMLNTAQFSAAKSVSEAQMMQAMVFDENGVVKSFYQFSEDVNEVVDISQQTWLRVEYETCRRSAAAGEKFSRMQGDSDLYPFWVYKGVMDSRERPEHVEMEGRVFQIGDPDGDACFPPIDWNCRCIGEPTDGQYLDENKLTPQTGAQARQLLEDNVDEQFRYNPAVQGPMPNKHSYFQTLPNANGGNAELFNRPTPSKDGPELTGLGAKGMVHLLNIVHDWKQEYHTDGHGDIIFQNEGTLANVTLPAAAIHLISKHSAGFENIPDTIEHPDEIWSRWEDANQQRVVMRTYILFGKTSYVVSTRDGIIIDAAACSNGALNKFRKGILL